MSGLRSYMRAEAGQSQGQMLKREEEEEEWATQTLCSRTVS